MDTTIPEEVIQLVADLEFIATTPAEHKPCVFDKSFVHEDSWYGSYKRWKNGESKEHLEKHLSTLTDTCIGVVNTYSTNAEIIMFVMPSIVRFRSGLQQIRTNYSKFPGIAGKLKALIANLDRYIAKYTVS